MLREYPFSCRSCGYAEDLFLEMSEINNQSCPKCNSDLFKQDFASKARGLSIRIPHSFRATAYSFDAPNTSVYDKGADVEKIIANSEGDLQ